MSQLKYPDEMHMNVASDQGVHCLLTKCSIILRMKMDISCNDSTILDRLVKTLRVVLENAFSFYDGLFPSFRLPDHSLIYCK